MYGIKRGKQLPGISEVIYLTCDLYNIEYLCHWMGIIQPDEVYNFAAQSDAMQSIADPLGTYDINARAVLYLCEWIKTHKKDIRFFQAGSVEMFKGLHADGVLDETNLQFYPENPYAIAKLTAYWTVRYYRTNYNLHLCNGIIFNAESYRRHPKFVTRKITCAVKKMINDSDHYLEIGNLNAYRDWIHAYDTAMAAWQMIQHPTPDDYIINLSQNHTVRDFINLSCIHAGIHLSWTGTGLHEIATDSNGKTRIIVNPSFFRPNDHHRPLLWSNQKLKSIGWTPKHSLSDIIQELLDYA